MERLHPDNLRALTGQVRTPGYARDSLRPGIVHFGLGAFHRAHQALYTERAIEHSGGDWGIVGVSLRSATVCEQLMPQAGLYSLLSEDASGATIRVIGAVKQVLVAPKELDAVVDAIADPAIHVITLTITEKGYHLAADGVGLDQKDESILADLNDPECPRTALGLLALGLRRRASAGAGPITLLSCDNIAQNSHKLRGVLIDYLRASFSELVPWLEANVRFPCSMVDRIVPAPSDAQRERQSKALGLWDAAAVSTEPFHQWIIEDDFAGDRPAWDQVGVQLVSDVRPFEAIKLRLLNASHSAIAYCGLLAGMHSVDEVMADDTLGNYIARLMFDELVPALSIPDGFDIRAYCNDLLQRFSNPRLEHQCAQIAMDGSEKIPQRWLPGLQTSGSLLRKALAVWCYVVLETELAVDDPRSGLLLQARGDAVASQQERLIAVLGCARIDAGSCAEFDALFEAVAKSVQVIRDDGLRVMLASELVQDLSKEMST